MSVYKKIIMNINVYIYFMYLSLAISTFLNEM